MNPLSSPFRINSDVARAELWRRGILHWKLDSAQKILYNQFKTSKDKILVWNCSRQIGKSFSLITIALEFCLANPNVQVKYCAGQAKSVAKIIKPTLRKLLQECPKDLRPKWNREGGVWNFSNGSLLYVEGIDGDKADDLRGTPAHLVIVDEAGFVKNLSYAVYSVLMPMTSTTKGRIIIVSTPPKSSDHELKDFIEQAKMDKSYTEIDIYRYLDLVKDDEFEFKDRLPPDEVERIRKKTKKSDFEREYLCKIVTDEEYAVIPEFNAELKYKICIPWAKPPRFDSYVSMDLGTKDLTAVIFAYLDFRNNKLIIEDEFYCNGQKVTSRYLAEGIKAKERQLWSDHEGIFKPPYKRISDNNEAIARQELGLTYDLQFTPTRKDEKDAALHDLRVRLENGQIIIHPRCERLIVHLESAVWNKNKSSFERSKDNGHYDFVDSLIYLVRNIDWHKNPYPTDWGWPTNYFKWANKEQLSQSAETIKSLFVKRNNNK